MAVMVWSNDMELVINFLWFNVYILPAWIAVIRGHLNQNPIAIINLLLGWTGILWIICLAWAFSSNTKALRYE